MPRVDLADIQKEAKMAEVFTDKERSVRDHEAMIYERIVRKERQAEKFRQMMAAQEEDLHQAAMAQKRADIRKYIAGPIQMDGMILPEQRSYRPADEYMPEPRLYGVKPELKTCKWHRVEGKGSELGKYTPLDRMSVRVSHHEEAAFLRTKVQEDTRRQGVAALAVKRSLREWPVCGNGGEVKLEWNKAGECRWNCSCGK